MPRGEALCLQTPRSTRTNLHDALRGALFGDMHTFCISPLGACAAGCSARNGLRKARAAGAGRQHHSRGAWPAEAGHLSSGSPGTIRWRYLHTACYTIEADEQTISNTRWRAQASDTMEETCLCSATRKGRNGWSSEGASVGHANPLALKKKVREKDNERPLMHACVQIFKR